MEHAHRKLTTHQITVLIQVLRTFPNERVAIVYSAAASDGRAYALDFMAIFKAIGWDVSGPEAAEFPGGESVALALLVSAGGGIPACAEALRDALRIYEIEVETRVGGEKHVAADGFGLWVGEVG